MEIGVRVQGLGEIQVYIVELRYKNEDL